MANAQRTGALAVVLLVLLGGASQAPGQVVDIEYLADKATKPGGPWPARQLLLGPTAVGSTVTSTFYIQNHEPQQQIVTLELEGPPSFAFSQLNALGQPVGWHGPGAGDRLTVTVPAGPPPDGRLDLMARFTTSTVSQLAATLRSVSPTSSPGALDLVGVAAPTGFDRPRREVFLRAPSEVAAGDEVGFVTTTVSTPDAVFRALFPPASGIEVTEAYLRYTSTSTVPGIVPQVLTDVDQVAFGRGATTSTWSGAFEPITLPGGLVFSTGRIGDVLGAPPTGSALLGTTWGTDGNDDALAALLLDAQQEFDPVRLVVKFTHDADNFNYNSLDITLVFATNEVPDSVGSLYVDIMGVYLFPPNEDFVFRQDQLSLSPTTSVQQVLDAVSISDLGSRAHQDFVESFQVAVDRNRNPISVNSDMLKGGSGVYFPFADIAFNASTKSTTFRGCVDAQVQPGGAYTLVIVLADGGDTFVDSAVFVGAITPNEAAPNPDCRGPVTEGPRSVPNPLDFGSVDICTTSSRSLRIENGGLFAFEVSEVRLDPAQGTDPFFLDSLPQLPVVLSPGDHFNLSVDFAPETVATFDSTEVVIVSNASENATLRVPLSGQGRAVSLLVIDPPTVAFGGIPVGQSASTTVQLRNPTACFPLQIDTIQLVQPSSGAFTITPERFPPTQVPDGGNFQNPAWLGLQVEFTPTASQSYADFVRITSNDLLQPTKTLPLIGSGGSPALEADPAVVDFGQVVIGRDEVQDVTVTNVGGAAVDVTSIDLQTGLAPVRLTVPALPQTLQPGGELQFSVTADPEASEIGEFTERVIVSSTTSTLEVPVLGTAGTFIVELEYRPDVDQGCLTNVGTLDVRVVDVLLAEAVGVELLDIVPETLLETGETLCVPLVRTAPEISGLLQFVITEPVDDTLVLSLGAAVSGEIEGGACRFGGAGGAGGEDRGRRLPSPLPLVALVLAVAALAMGRCGRDKEAGA